MNLDMDILTEEAESEIVEMGLAGPAGQDFILWLEKYQLPSDLIEAVKRISPKKEIWAGAGTIYPEQTIMNELSEANDLGVEFILPESGQRLVF